MISRAQLPVFVSATMGLRGSTAGGSGAFLVLADDGHRYWCKSLNNFQSTRVPVTEQIVARLGARIGAPVCEAALVRLDALVGWELRLGSGRLVEAGWAHGSLALEPVLETRMLEHRSEDDNSRRHCGVYALCDWLLGADVQWLYAVQHENAYYSHDHGFFLTGPDWTVDTLLAQQHAPAPLSIPSGQLNPGELERLADALEQLSRSEIEGVLSELPADWPVSDTELEVVADVVDLRRAPTAARLRAMVA